MKDHQIREKINEVHRICLTYHGMGQLRQRIASALVPCLGRKPVEPSNEELLKMIGENTGKRINLGLDDLDQYLSVARAAIKLARQKGEEER